MFSSLTRTDPDASDLPLAPTERDTIFRNGTARVYRFRSSRRRKEALPLLLVPSLINRWYVLDLRPGTSLVEALVDAGFDVFALDWGIAQPEDRHLEWEHLLDRLRRSIGAVRRCADTSRIGLLGYCMGGTLTAIHAALHPDEVGAYVHLTAPVDFSEAGLLGRLVDEEWFDASAIADAGNIAPSMMQSGFVALRPTGQIAKWINLADRIDDEDHLQSFRALETWVNDNVPFPAAAYETYIERLYQENRLIRGRHHVRGSRVDLAEIEAPVLTVAAEYDHICPPKSARALNDCVGSDDVSYQVVSAGHVGAVVGSKGPAQLYPTVAEWFDEHASPPR